MKTVRIISTKERLESRTLVKVIIIGIEVMLVWFCSKLRRIGNSNHKNLSSKSNFVSHQNYHKYITKIEMGHLFLIQFSCA